MHQRPPEKDFRSAFSRPCLSEPTRNRTFVSPLPCPPPSRDFARRRVYNSYGLVLGRPRGHGPLYAPRDRWFPSGRSARRYITAAAAAAAGRRHGTYLHRRERVGVDGQAVTGGNKNKSFRRIDAN